MVVEGNDRRDGRFSRSLKAIEDKDKDDGNDDEDNNNSNFIISNINNHNDDNKLLLSLRVSLRGDCKPYPHNVNLVNF